MKRMMMVWPKTLFTIMRDVREMFLKKKTAKSMPMTVRTEMNPRKKMKWHRKVGSVGTIGYAT